MKYFIVINQKAWIENFPKASLMAAAIFDVIEDICAIQAPPKITYEQHRYTPISWQKIAAALPLAKIKNEQTVLDALKELKKLGLIKIFRSEGVLYVAITREASKLEFEQNPQSEEAI